MVEFLIDNLYVGFGGHVYQQIVGISMGTNAPKWANYLDLRLKFDEDGQGRIQGFRKWGGGGGAKNRDDCACYGTIHGTLTRGCDAFCVAEGWFGGGDPLHN